MIKLVSLHKHWCIADSIKQFISAPVPVDDGIDRSEEFVRTGQMYSSFMRLSVWYSLMYVVVEGYRALKLQDAEIDELLKRSDYVEALRLFRNSNFHFQNDPFSTKFMSFIELDESTQWARRLNKAFKKFFENTLPLEDFLPEKKNGIRELIYLNVH